MLDVRFVPSVLSVPFVLSVLSPAGLNPRLKQHKVGLRRLQSSTVNLPAFDIKTHRA